MFQSTQFIELKKLFVNRQPIFFIILRITINSSVSSGFLRAAKLCAELAAGRCNIRALAMADGCCEVQVVKDFLKCYDRALAGLFKINCRMFIERNKIYFAGYALEKPCQFTGIDGSVVNILYENIFKSNSLAGGQGKLAGSSQQLMDGKFVI